MKTDGTLQIPVEFIGLDRAAEELRAKIKPISDESFRESQAYAKKLASITDASAIDRIEAERAFHKASQEFLSESERAQFASEESKIRNIRDSKQRERALIEQRHKAELLIATRTGADLGAVRRKQIDEIDKLEKRATTGAEARAKASIDRVTRYARSAFDALQAFAGLQIAGQLTATIRDAAQVGLEGMALLDLDKQTARAYQGVEATDRVIQAFGDSVSREYAMKVAALGNGFHFTADQIEALALVAQTSMPVTGKSIEESLQAAFDTVTKGSKDAAEQLAIVFDVEAAQTKYAASIGKTVAQLTEYEKRTANVIGLTAAATDRLNEFGADKTVNDIQRLNAALDDYIAQLKRIAATDIVNPWASLIVSGSMQFVTETQSRADQAEASVKRMVALESELMRRRTAGGLSLAERMPTSEEFEIAGVSAARARELSDNRANAYLALGEAIQSLRVQLQAAQKDAARLRGQETATAEAARAAALAREEEALKAEQERQARLESMRRILAIDREFVAERKRLAESAVAEEQKTSDARLIIGESETNRRLRLLQERHTREVEFADEFGSRLLEQTRARHKEEIAAAKQAGADLTVLQMAQAAETQAIRSRFLDIGDLLRKQKAEYDREVAEIVKAQSDLAYDKATEAFKKQTESRIDVLQREIAVMTRWLKTRGDLTDGEARNLMTRVAAKRDELGTLSPVALSETDAKLSEDLRFATPELAALAEFGNTDLSGVRDQLFGNVISPLEIAIDTARSFGDALFDAGWAAIFEGKSFKKATNELLREIAKRSIKLALFSAAQAALAAGTGQYDKAGELIVAAGLFGALGVVTGIGAAATGGLSGERSARDRGADKPRGIGADRGSQVTLNLYVTQNGLRSTREDARFIIDTVAEYAGTIGFPTLPSTVIRAN